MSLMRFDHIIIGIFIIAVFSIGMVVMIGDIESNYDDVNMTSDDFMNITPFISEMLDITEASKNRTLDADISGSDESWESMTKGSYKAFRLLKNSFSIFSQMAQHAEDKLMIPSAFVTIGIGALIITILSGIIYMIFRFIPK